MSQDSASAAMTMLRVCQTAFAYARPFRFEAGDNPCDFRLDAQERASSEDLAARIEFVLKMAAATRAGATPSRLVTQETVHVALYEHRHGNDIRVLTSPEGVAKWRREIADEWFENEFDEPKPSDPQAMTDVYFERVGEFGESFSSQELKIEG